ncbi:MAG: multiheme c-type cytochrome [bacterium]
MWRSFLLQGTLLFSITLTGVFAEEGKYQKSATCKPCHLQIYDQWQNSRHAKSTPAENILFAKIYKKSQRDTRGETKLYCIKCHAPVSTINGDTDLEEEVTNEGVGCDICHTAAELSVEPDRWPIIYQPGKTKFGPYEDSEAKIHQTAYSKQLRTSEFCGSCHGPMIDIEGTRSCGDLTICDTYGEWKGSSQAEKGIGCQDCHMGTKKGQAAKNGPVREQVHGHGFEGAYSQEQLKKAAELAMEVKEFGGHIIATINITNSGSGHRLPTGPPPRMVILKVSAFDENGHILWTNWEENPGQEDPYGVFHIVFADSAGKAPAFPWVAARIFKDTRLEPDETRQLIYKFPAQGVTRVEAKLFYRLAPLALLDKFEIPDPYLRTPFLMAKLTKDIE